MKGSTQKMLMYGAIIIVIAVIVWFMFFRKTEEQKKEETVANAVKLAEQTMKTAASIVQQSTDSKKENFRYYRRLAILDSIKAYFIRNKDTIIKKFNTLKSALKLVGIDLCQIINDRKQLSKLIKQNIKKIIAKAASLPLVGDKLASALSLGDDENDKSEIVVSFVRDTLLGFYDDNIQILSKRMDCDDDDEEFRYYH